MLMVKIPANVIPTSTRETMLNLYLFLCQNLKAVMKPAYDTTSPNMNHTKLA